MTVINLTGYFVGSLFVDLKAFYDWLFSVAWTAVRSVLWFDDLAFREQNYYFFLIFTAPKQSGWRRWPVKNHLCETKTTSRLREDGSDILQADYTSKMGKAITHFFTLTLVFKMPGLHVASNTVAKSIPKCNISGFIGIILTFGAALVGLVGRCIFCLFGGWSAPVQVIPIPACLGKAVLSERGVKQGLRLWTTLKNP